MQSRQSKKKSSDIHHPPFYGDRTFSEAVTFKRDAMVAREIAFAAAEGDVGRVWEALKVNLSQFMLPYLTYFMQAMLFTFAGSGHSNYTSYLLEIICEIELESSPALQEAFLLSLLVNPTGEDGGFVPGDIFQEGLNRCLEPIVQRKDAEYGSWHIRHVWARNLKDIQELKSEFRSTVGLSKCSGHPKDPHEKPEFKTLLREYRNAEIHLRRPGRTISAEALVTRETQEG